MKKIYLLFCLILSGCASVATMQRERPDGGHIQVIGPGSMAEPGRQKAIALIEKKCPGGWTELEHGTENTGATMSAGYGATAPMEAYFIDFKCK